jgi:hypothetical protein
MSPRMQITREVLERAKDCGDDHVIAACRRIINADRIGWHKHGRKSDLDLIYAFVD